LVSMNPRHFADRETQQLALPLGHHQPLVHGTGLVPGMLPFQSEQPPQRNANQQLAPDVDQAENDSLLSMREGMDGPPLGDLPKNPGGQREPFRANAKNDGGLFAGRGPLFFQREMLRPLPPVLRRSLA